jgi:hypothetical protein
MFRRAVVFAGVCLAAPLLTSCDTDVNAVVCHWGDSVMTQTSPAILEKEVLRDNGYVPVFDAIGGSSLHNWDAYWKTRIPKVMAAVNCDANVVMIGNNDTTDAEVQADPDLYVEQFLDALGDAPLVYVTPDRSAPPAGRAAIVDAVDRVTATRPDTIVIEPQTVAGWATTDGTHPTDTGKSAIAQAIEDALDQFFGNEHDANSPYDPPRVVPPSTPTTATTEPPTTTTEETTTTTGEPPTTTTDATTTTTADTPPSP